MISRGDSVMTETGKVGVVIEETQKDADMRILLVQFMSRKTGKPYSQWIWERLLKKAGA